MTWRRWAVWAALLAGVTIFLFGYRGRLDKAHITLVYLFVVMAGTMQGGRRLGLTLAAVAFLLFNWFFLPPYNTFVINDPLDWLVLIAFLIVSATIAEMLHRLRDEADAARQRAVEIDRFATLGAEALKVGRAEEALAAVATLIGSTLELAACRIHTVPDSGESGAPGRNSLVTWTAEHGRVAIRQMDGTTRLTDSALLPEGRLEDATGLFLPLNVRGRVIGVLEMESRGRLGLTAAQQRFLAALTHYAALAVERARLEAEAGRVEALREADRMKDALLASVSHDLRTPLTTIKALAHDLAASDPRAADIEEEADRLNRMVADLLDLTRLKGGALSLNLAINAVDELLGVVLQRTAGAFPGRDLQVRLEEGGTLLLGRFDLMQATRILVNLLENAHKYAPNGTAIEVAGRAIGESIDISVLDRGPGVDPAEGERIFEPFYRPPGTLPDVGGAGLGLAIARELARAQGGDLRYALRPGGGSAFVLRLPRADFPEAIPAS